ncbi:hypothetical protein V6Z88_002183 [Aspergillus fumigatus]
MICQHLVYTTIILSHFIRQTADILLRGCSFHSRWWTKPAGAHSAAVPSVRVCVWCYIPRHGKPDHRAFPAYNYKSGHILLSGWELFFGWEPATALGGPVHASFLASTSPCYDDPSSFASVFNEIIVKEL